MAKRITGSTGATKPATKAAAKPASARRATGATKTAAATAKPATALYVHFGVGHSPYSGIAGFASGAVLLAALILTGFARWDAKARRIAAGRGGGNLALLRQAVGDTAVNHHAKSGAIDKAAKALTEGGAAFLNTRIDGTSRAMRTDADTVEAVIAAMRDGGKVGDYAFGRKLGE